MKNSITQIFCALALFLFGITSAMAQVANCNQFINVSLDNSCQVILTPDAIEEGGPYAENVSLSLSQTVLDVTNLGVNSVTLTATDINGNTATCSTFVKVEDKLPPVAICVADLTVAAGSDGTFQLTASQIDNGSYDNCNNVTLSISPTLLTCDLTSVTLTVEDQSGNLVQCTTEVTMTGGNNNSILSCNNNQVFNISNGAIELFPANFLEGNTGGCSVASLQIQNADGSIQNDNVINASDSGNTYTAVVTNAVGNSCWALFTVSGSSSSSVIANCTQFLNVSLNPWACEATLTPDMIDNGSTGYETLSLSQTQFNETNIGVNSVTMTATAADGSDATCTCLVSIEDKTPPVAVCDAEVTVALTSLGTATLFAESFDNGSYDACSDVTLSISPSVLTCEDGPTAIVTITVTDEYGNWNQCFTEVEIVGGEENATLACINGVTVDVATGPVQLFAEDFLAGNSGSCNDVTLEIQNADGTIQDDNIVDLSDAGNTYTYMLTADNGNSCWGLLIVNGTPCTDTITICDTECNSAPFGDCDSGHTSTDDVEWPCDLTLSYCDLINEDFSPEGLVATNLVNTANAEPQLTIDGCEIVGVAYADVVFTDSDGLSIERTWTVIDWISEEVFTYIQTIIIDNATTNICDTQAWNTPVTDCAGGHTLEDDVEWPANITVNTIAISPAQLAANVSVNVYDVQPRLFENCGEYATVHDDLYIDEGATTKVLRTWSILNWNNNQVFTYVQIITIDFSVSQSICIYTEDGTYVPAVNLSTGEITPTDEGCLLSAAAPNTTVTAQKTDIWSAGVNVLDLILMREHVLGITLLSPYQQIAADINGNGAVTTLDLVLLEDLMDNNGVTDEAWKFFDFNTFLSPSITMGAFITNQFIGVKMGDIDNSLSFGNLNSTGTTTLNSLDEVINSDQEYRFTFDATETINVAGMEMNFDYDISALEINAISSDLLPDFNMNDHVTIVDGKIRIQYALSLDALENGGLIINDDEAIITIDFRATDNAILSEKIEISSATNSFIKEFASTSLKDIDLSWDDKIANKTQDIITADQVNVFPNPTSDFISIETALKGTMNYTIADITGQEVLRGTLNANTIDVQSLTTGTYILMITHESGVYVDKLLKL